MRFGWAYELELVWTERARPCGGAGSEKYQQGLRQLKELQEGWKLPCDQYFSSALHFQVLYKGIDMSLPPDRWSQSKQDVSYERQGRSDISSECLNNEAVACTPGTVFHKTSLLSGGAAAGKTDQGVIPHVWTWGCLHQYWHASRAVVLTWKDPVPIAVTCSCPGLRDCPCSV